MEGILSATLQSLLQPRIGVPILVEPPWFLVLIVLPSWSSRIPVFNFCLPLIELFQAVVLRGLSS